jgi:hypothetical protein
MISGLMVILGVDWLVFVEVPMHLFSLTSIGLAKVYGVLLGIIVIVFGPGVSVQELYQQSRWREIY